MKKLIHRSVLFFVVIAISTAQGQTIQPSAGQPGQAIQQSANPSTPPTGYYEVGFGASAPLGGFANISGKGYGEYATLGNNFNFSIAVPINHSNFGIAFMYASYDNFFDMGSYVNNIQISDPTKNYSGINSAEYDENLIMLGLFATYPIDRLSFDFRLMGGVAFCYLPEVDYGADPINEGYYNYEWDTYSSRSTSFAFDIGGGVRYKVRRMSVMLNVDFMTTNPMVSTTQQYTDANGNNFYSHVNCSSPVSLLNIDLGIGYRIK